MAERRLFFALWPDERQRETLREVLGPSVHQVEGQAVPRGNWHVTLAFVGGFPEARIPALLAAAGRIEVLPFRLRFDRLVFWQRPRIACLQAVSVPAELAGLVASLNEVLNAFGVVPETGTYRPHVTSVRKARAFEPIPLARALDLRWEGFELVESVSQPEGVRYRPVKQGVPRDS